MGQEGADHLREVTKKKTTEDKREEHTLLPS